MKNSLYILILVFALTSCKKDDPQPAASSSASAHPVSCTLESVVMTGFNPLNYLGEHYDSASNAPDPFIEISKDDVLVYTSVVIGGADNETSYPMNTAATGTLPITFIEGQSMSFRVEDNDSATDTDFMGIFDIDDMFNFVYSGDQAEEFTDVFVSTQSGNVTFLLSGTFEY